MKPASAGLIALLNSATQFYMADLYTFTLADGSVLRFSGAETDIKVGANTYSVGGLRFVRGATRLVIGLEVDTLDITVYTDAATTVAGKPFLSFVRAGGLDGAEATLERAFMLNWGDVSNGAVTLFAGRVANAEVGRASAKLTVKSNLELLNVKMPRNLYQPGCVHTLYDSGCGLLKSNYAVSGAAAAGSTKTVITSALGQATGYFDLGMVQFTAGANAGQKRTVRSFAAGAFTVSLPLPFAPAAGDAFTAWPGCDKTQATCTTKFNNLANFRGFPFIPVPETAR